MTSRAKGKPDFDQDNFLERQLGYQLRRATTVLLRELAQSLVELDLRVTDATILHLMGMDHKRLTYQFQGRDFRLTDVRGRVVREILA